MSTESRTPHEPAGGDGLMFLIAMAVVVVVAVEALFIAFAGWWFMAAALLLVICAAIGVTAALARLIEEDVPIAAPRRAPVSEQAPERRTAPAALPRPVAH
jgi:hypothetical protein